MKKNFKKFICIVSITILCLSLVACGNSEKQTTNNDGSSEKSVEELDSEKKDLKLGCLEPTEPVMQWIKEGLKSQGYNIEVVLFDANQLPATATKDGDLDGFIHNHKPWIDTFNEENNCDLVMIEPYYYYGFFGMYSTKHESIDEIPEDAQIAVPGDPSNMDRSLVLLEEAGLLTLGEKVDSFYTKLDIKDNPKNIKLIETEISQTARSIDDVDAIIAPSQRVIKTGKVDPKDYLFEDPQNKDYPVGLVVESEDTNEKWTKDVMDFLRTDEMKEKFNELFQGTNILFE